MAAGTGIPVQCQRYRLAPATPDHLTEALTRQFIRWATARVAIEISSSVLRGNGTAQLLAPVTRLEHWDRYIAGHFAGEDKCVPDEHGRTFFSSSWRDQQGRRLILIFEDCC